MSSINNQTPQPPQTGLALRYEILHRNKSSLESVRQDLISATTRGDSIDNDKLRHLHVQTIFHRTSLQCLLHSAKENARREKKEEDVAALDALWHQHHDELEREMFLPHRMGLDDKNNIGVIDLDDAEEAPDDLADKFFEMYPEVARLDEDNLEYSSSDEVSVIEVELETRQRKKNRGNKDDPIVVSGENSPTDLVNGKKAHPQAPNNFHSNHSVTNTSNLQSHSSYQQQHQPPNNFNNPYNQPQNRQQSRYQQQHQQQPFQHQNQWQKRPSTGCFDYNEPNENQPVKENPFRTAKEVQGKLDTEDDWEGYEGRNNNNFRNTRNINNRQRSNHQDDQYRNNNNNMNSRANNTSRPQQLVKTALNGPKQNISSGLQKKYQNPKLDSNNNNSSNNNSNKGGQTNKPRHANSNGGEDDDELPEELKGLNKDLVKRIENDIVDSGEKVSFDDIAGLDHAKRIVDEVIIFPLRNPHLFTGLRQPPKGLLLFGPPGTGKTLIAKAIAHESGATFFSVSSSSLTSKWIGEGEQLVKTLFAVARYREPSVIFVDEVDSMLTARSSEENEASRRIKTEFLTAMEGAGNENQARFLMIGATNRPQELDDAMRRRFVKRLYVALPEQRDRECLLRKLLSKNQHNISEKEFFKLAKKTEGFSGADLKNLCNDAAMGPVRELGANVMTATANDLPPISYKHCRQALKSTSPSVATADLKAYLEWNDLYGTKPSSEKGTVDTESDHESSDDEEN